MDNFRYEGANVVNSKEKRILRQIEAGKASVQTQWDTNEKIRRKRTAMTMQRRLLLMILATKN